MDETVRKTGGGDIVQVGRRDSSLTSLDQGRKEADQALILYLAILIGQDSSQDSLTPSLFL